MMTGELSSNWKQLQARLKSAALPAAKRKAIDDEPSHHAAIPVKRTRTSQPARSSKPPAGQTMGPVQSRPARTHQNAGLALWAEDHDISSEALAEAYKLGTKDTSLLTATDITPNAGLTKNQELGKYLAIDCEMVGVGEQGAEHSLARVSIVDFHGQQVYDSFVKQRKLVTDWRTSISGVSRKDMATARKFTEVQNDVAKLLKGRYLVGHDVGHDLEVLELQHPPQFMRDTAKFAGFKKYGHGPKPALRVLAKQILGLDIQSGKHSSIEDARVAMLLFRRYKTAFDAEYGKRYGQPTAKPKVGQKKDKRKSKI